MKTTSIVIALIAIAAMSCKQADGMATGNDPQEVAAPAEAPAAAPVAAPTDNMAAADKPMAAAPAEEPVRANNTEKNERDRNAAALTPTDQSESEADRTITQQARQGVVGADKVSAAAKNVKIVTVDGVVTLRGPVESAREKTQIATLVNKVEGVKRVDNQLEVAGK